MQEFISFLELNKFKVKQFSGHPDCYTFDGYNVFGGFSFEYWLDDYGMLSRRVLADNKDCWDKWQKCSINCPIEKVINDRYDFINWVKWLGTKDGFEYTDNYKYYYPKENIVKFFDVKGAL